MIARSRDELVIARMLRLNSEMIFTSDPLITGGVSMMTGREYRAFLGFDDSAAQIELEEIALQAAMLEYKTMQALNSASTAMWFFGLAADQGIAAAQVQQRTLNEIAADVTHMREQEALARARKYIAEKEAAEARQQADFEIARSRDEQRRAAHAALVERQKADAVIARAREEVDAVVVEMLSTIDTPAATVEDMPPVVEVAPAAAPAVPEPVMEQSVVEDDSELRVRLADEERRERDREINRKRREQSKNDKALAAQQKAEREAALLASKPQKEPKKEQVRPVKPVTNTVTTVYHSSVPSREQVATSSSVVHATPALKRKIAKAREVTPVAPKAFAARPTTTKSEREREARERAQEAEDKRARLAIAGERIALEVAEQQAAYVEIGRQPIPRVSYPTCLNFAYYGAIKAGMAIYDIGASLFHRPRGVDCLHELAIIKANYNVETQEFTNLHVAKTALDKLFTVVGQFNDVFQVGAEHIEASIFALRWFSQAAKDKDSRVMRRNQLFGRMEHPSPVFNRIAAGNIVNYLLWHASHCDDANIKKFLLAKLFDRDRFAWPAEVNLDGFRRITAFTPMHIHAMFEYLRVLLSGECTKFVRDGHPETKIPVNEMKEFVTRFMQNMIIAFRIIQPDHDALLLMAHEMRELKLFYQKALGDDADKKYDKKFIREMGVAKTLKGFDNYLDEACAHFLENLEVVTPLRRGMGR